MTDREPRRAVPHWAWMAVVAGLALVVRLLYVWQIRATSLVLPEELDPGFYYNWAKSIAAGDWIGRTAFVQSPLYAYLLGLFMTLFGAAVTPILVVQSLLGVLTVVLTCLAGRLFFDTRRGLVAGLLLALYGPFVFYEGMVMKTFLSPLLTVLLALLLGYAARRSASAPLTSGGAMAPEDDPPAAAPVPNRTTGLFAGAGLVFGLLCLDRDNFVLLAPILAVLAAVLADGGGQDARRRRLVAACAFVLGTAAVILPVTLRNYAVSREFVLLTTGGGEVFFIGNNADANGLYVPPPFVRPDPQYEHADFVARATEIEGRKVSPMESSWFWFRQGLAFIAGHPLKWVRLLWLKFLHFWNWYELPDNLDYTVAQYFSSVLGSLNLSLPPAGFPAPAVPAGHGVWLPIRLHLWSAFGTLVPLALLGVVLSRRRWRSLLTLYVLAFGYMATVMFFFNFSRFRVPIVPILALFAAEGLAGFGQSLGRLRSGAPFGAPRTLGLAGLFVVVLAFANVELPRGVIPAIEQTLLIGNELYAEGESEKARQSYDVGLVLLGEGPKGPEVDAVLRRQFGRGVSRDAIVRELEIESIARGPQYKGIHLGIHHGLGIAMLQQAQVLLQQGERDQALPLLDQAIGQFTEALKIAPAYLLSHRKMARACQLRGDTPQAVEWLKKAVDLWPEDLETRFDLAEMLYSTGEYRDALTQLEAARHYNPSMDPQKLAQVYFERGLVFMRGLEDPGKALYDMEKAIALDPGHPQAQAIQGAIRELRARGHEAVPDEPPREPEKAPGRGPAGKPAD